MAKTKNTAPMNFRAPAQLCNDFKLACAKMGVSYSTVFTACMIATLRNKKIPFEIGFDDDFITIDTDENIMSDTDYTNNAINNTSNDSENTTSDSNSNKDNSKDFKFFDDMWVENKDK